MSLVVITGANRGIGLELARLLKGRGHTVMALCRSSSNELDNLGVDVLTGFDVTSDDLSPVRDFIGERKVHLLINNAGLLERTTLADLDLESIRRQFEVNTLGPLKIAQALVPNLVEGSKVAHITSRMGSVADNTSGSHYGYRMSKAALNMATKSLAVDLKHKGIAVCVLHPGYVRTQMTLGHGEVEPSFSAAGLLARIDELTLETTGSFWHAQGQNLPW